MRSLSRSLLLLILSCVAWTACAATLNVRDFGAAGDGKNDDYAALQRAVSALTTAEAGSELFFPAGTYRIATESPGALFLRDARSCTIRFADGAKLWMDNLRPDGTGGGHGVVIAAPGYDVTCENITVEWRTRPSSRSHGDAFRFEGFPSEEDGKSLRNIRLLNCRALYSPQTGAVFMGVRGITVRNFTVQENLADGLHFNACREIDVDGVTGIGNGDDTVGIVTYYAPEFAGECGTIFSFPALNAWSNSGAVIRNVRAVGGNANGVRISGSRDVTLENITVENKSCGLILDSGLADQQRFLWSYQPSQGIRVKNLTATGCDSGVLVWCFSPAVPGFTDFDLTAETLRLTDNRNDNLHLWDVQNIHLQDIVSENGRIRLRGFRHISVESLRQKGAYLEIDGEYAATDPAKILPQQSEFSDIVLENATLTVTRTRGVRLDQISTGDAE